MEIVDMDFLNMISKRLRRKQKKKIEKSAQRIKRIVFISFCSEDLDEVNLKRPSEK